MLETSFLDCKSVGRGEVNANWNRSCKKQVFVRLVVFT